MNPFILPASTVTTALAGAITVLVVWLAKEFGNVEVPTDVAMAFTSIVSVLTAHFTTDNPSITKVEKPAPPQNEVIDVPADPKKEKK